MGAVVFFCAQSHWFFTLLKSQKGPFLTATAVVDADLSSHMNMESKSQEQASAFRPMKEMLNESLQWVTEVSRTVKTKHKDKYPQFIYKYT